MISHRTTLLALALLYLAAMQDTLAEKTWTYVLQSIEASSSDSDSIELTVSRNTVGRNLYSLSALLDIKKPVDEETMVEAKSYRSISGNTDYKPIPFQIPPQNYREFMNGFYKDCLMPSIRECSNLPYFEDEFEPPFEMKRYEINSCLIDPEKYPDNMPSGYYKIDLIITGKTSLNVTIFVKVDQKLA